MQRRLVGKSDMEAKAKFQGCNLKKKKKVRPKIVQRPKNQINEGKVLKYRGVKNSSESLPALLMSEFPHGVLQFNTNLQSLSLH